MSAGWNKIGLFLNRKRTPPKNVLRWFSGSLILLLLLGANVVGCFDSKRTRINEWLKFHHLAALPISATNLMYYQWNGLGTGETYIKFQISSNDLIGFKANSPGLSEGKKDVFSFNHQHLPYPTNSTGQATLNHVYFHKSRSFPDWYNPTITNQGEGYILWRGPDSKVIINQDTLTIYLKTVKG